MVESLGPRISKSEVSRICQGLDEQVDAFRSRPLERRYPLYPWLDAKVEKVRDGGRVVRKALVLAYGVHESGSREVIAVDVGEAETEAFWRSFLRSRVERRLTGVQPLVSDGHAGLKKAIAQAFACPWQRCTVHLLREALGHACREQQPKLAAPLRPLFNAAEGNAGCELVGDALERRNPLPKVAALLEEAEERLLAFYGFPPDHRPKLRSTNTLERVNRETGRRTDVVGIFRQPDPARRQRRDRTERRMARRPPLPVGALAGGDPRPRRRKDQNNSGDARQLTAA
jgi:putative transposase